MRVLKLQRGVMDSLFCGEKGRNQPAYAGSAIFSRNSANAA